MAETQLYFDNNISVTTARVIIGHATYALRNITSIKKSVHVKPADRVSAISLILAGGIISLFGFPCITEGSLIGLLIVLTISCSMIAVGVRGYRGARSTTDYQVAITSSAGETQTLTSGNQTYIEKIFAAINDAIVQAG